MQAEIGKRKDELGALRRAFDASEDFAVALRSADARMVSFVVSDPKFDSAAGRAVWDVETGRVCLSVRGLPTAKGASRHRVWLDDGRNVTQLTEFAVTPTGEAAIVIELPGGSAAPPPQTTLLVSLDAIADGPSSWPDQVILIGKLGSAVRPAIRGRPAGPLCDAAPQKQAYDAALHSRGLGNASQLRDSAGSHPLGRENVAFLVEARVMRIHEATIVPEFLVASDVLLALRLDALDIGAQLGHDFVLFVKNAEAGLEFGNQQQVLVSLSQLAGNP